MTIVAVTLMLAGTPTAAPAADGNVRRDADVSAVLLGAGLGTVAGAALGVGTAFALVYGTNDNGCYVGGCDAPLLSAVGISVVTGTVGALVGGTAGGVLAWSLAE